MKKTNFFRNAMMLIGTSILLVTTFTSCSKQNEAVTEQPGIETKGSQGCKGPIPGSVYVKEGQWGFVTLEYLGELTGVATFYISIPSDKPTTNALNIQTYVNNSSRQYYYNVPITSQEKSSRSMPVRGASAVWYDETCKVARVSIYELPTTIPMDVYVECVTL